MIETKQDGARMLLVGYDKDVAVMTKEGKPLLDKKGNQVYDESKRITGLISVSAFQMGDQARDDAGALRL
jgi:hypothetical protein